MAKKKFKISLGLAKQIALRSEERMKDAHSLVKLSNCIVPEKLTNKIINKMPEGPGKEIMKNKTLRSLLISDMLKACNIKEVHIIYPSSLFTNH